MNPMERTAIIEYLRRGLSPHRFQHCLGVETAALELAAKFGVDSKQASVAALLHDLCREYAPDLLLQLANKFGIVIDEIERAEPILLHGFVGAELAKRELNVVDPQILEAISYHITGAVNLSRLAQLIFVADFVEPGRNFAFVKEFRKNIPTLTPEQILLAIYNQTICYVVAKGYLIHPRSIEGRNELLLKESNE